MAMTNSLNFDSNTLVIDPNANRVGLGTSSPYAKLSVVGPVVAEYFHATSTTATSTFSGQTVAGFAPTLAHSFGSWSVGAAGANPLGASFIINPSSAAFDSNLLSLSVNGSAKFRLTPKAMSLPTLSWLSAAQPLPPLPLPPSPWKQHFWSAMPPPPT